jgi:hypothetical protein
MGLAPLLETLAKSIKNIASRTAAETPRAEVHAHFERVRVAAAQLERALNGLRNADKWMNVYEIDALHSMRQTLPDAVAACNSASDRMRKHRRSAGPAARVVCARIVIEIWALIRGKPPRGPHSPELYEICEEYWRECGMPPIGKTGDPGNWRRPLTRALSDWRASQSFITREALERAMVQNRPEKIGNAVP